MQSHIHTLGFSLTPNFITIEEEQELLSHMPKNPYKETRGRNTIERYGSQEPYKNGIISDTIPDHFTRLFDRLPFIPDSVTINEYHIGQSIVPHIDAGGEIITILSLASDARMILQLGQERYIVEIPSRSLSQMQGEIRRKWYHSIEPVKAVRYSIVFRQSN